jgi:hypothetical protein
LKRFAKRIEKTSQTFLEESRVDLWSLSNEIIELFKENFDNHQEEDIHFISAVLSE